MSFVPGSIDHNSVDMPFMANSITDEFTIDPCCNELLEKLSISKEIKQFYKQFSSSNQEIVINYWTFFNIEKMIEMTNKYHSDNIKTIDLAFEYKGMGWVNVAFYYPENNKILFRMDGGSSGWDRQDNYKLLKNFDLNEFKNGITFEEFLIKIKNNTRK